MIKRLADYVDMLSVFTLENNVAGGITFIAHPYMATK